MRKIIVVGGGAGGMMAAISAAEEGAQVIIVEKTERLGKKMLIAGKGRCNITNDAEIREFIKNYPHNGKFLYAAFSQFSNEQTKAFFEAENVPLKVERGDRVFPVSDKSQDIVHAMERKMKSLGVDIRLKTRVQELILENGVAKGVLLDTGKPIYGDAVIVATGGASYPGTGSTGDGYHFAKQAGHEIVPLRPSLIPLESSDGWIRMLQGLSLKNVSLTIYTDEGKELDSGFGEMMFTHFGITGPIVLTMSATAVDYWQNNKKPLRAVLDLKPALTEEKLDQRLLREIEEQHKKQLKNSLHALLPAKMIPVCLQLTELQEETMMYQLSREDRLRLGKFLKSLEFTLTKPRPITEAIVTAGGVQVKEINPKTMESKQIDNLFFVGEVLDVDGVTGGFNLQAALSTGYVAGGAAALS